MEDLRIPISGRPDTDITCNLFIFCCDSSMHWVVRPFFNSSPKDISALLPPRSKNHHGPTKSKCCPHSDSDGINQRKEWQMSVKILDLCEAFHDQLDRTWEGATTFVLRRSLYTTNSVETEDRLWDTARILNLHRGSILMFYFSQLTIKYVTPFVNRPSDLALGGNRCHRMASGDCKRQ